MSKKDKKEVSHENVFSAATEQKPMDKKSRFRSLLTKRNIIFGIIGLLFLMQYIQVQRIFGTFSFFSQRDTSLITEIGQIKESYTQIGNDLNEVRNFLRLPTTNYATIEEAKAEPEEGKNEDEIQMAMFQYVDYLAQNKNVEANLNTKVKQLEDLFASTNYVNKLAEKKMQMSEILQTTDAYFLTVNFEEGGVFATYYLAKESGNFYLKTALEKTEINYENSETFIKDAITLVDQKSEEVKKAWQEISAKKVLIVNALEDTKVQEEIQKLGISISQTPLEENLQTIYEIKNKSGDLIGKIILDNATQAITLVDVNDPSITVTVGSEGPVLIPFLQKLDTKTYIEKKAEEAKLSVQNTITDKGFKLLLEENGLTISDQPEEDDSRLYYYISDSSGAKLSAIVVEKATGVVNIVKPDGTSAENLLFFDPDFKKKTLELPSEIPEYGEDLSHEDDTFNILIAGKHGSLIDTMIFAHIDETKGEMRMISIPRDLFYNGRKINSFAFYYGLPELKRVLSDVSGYELDKYILIDMYAFIEVIDLIGGIDIHLDSAVIDPTYRTVDNGVEGTLHYEPGDYHLGGKEALRLARTRHTSSDFARAARQQMIIEALQDKARNFGFGDADTIYEITKTVLSKTETDIGLEEAIAYYFRYQNYDIVSNAVMSSGNVLYVPPYITAENCKKLEEEALAAGAADPGCADENHAYTLLPRNNNWNVIKWFFKQEFEAV